MATHFAAVATHDLNLMATCAKIAQEQIDFDTPSFYFTLIFCPSTIRSAFFKLLSLRILSTVVLYFREMR